jgi:phage-related holin
MIRNFGAFVEIEVSDKVNFGMLITIWLSITELLSILENIQRLGVNMPGFLEKYLDEIRNKIEKEK